MFLGLLRDELIVAKGHLLPHIKLCGQQRAAAGNYKEIAARDFSQYSMDERGYL